MSLFRVFDTASSALSAQSVRLNLTASNLANAETVGTTEDDAYRARRPVFAAMIDRFAPDAAASGVRVTEIQPSEAPLLQVYRPEHPLADAEGYVFSPNVSAVEEMADMISASRSYQNNVEVMNTSKEMLLRTLNLGN